MTPSPARRTAGLPIRLLFFSNSRVRGGVEEHILTLLRGLSRDNFCLHFVCTPEVAGRLRSDTPPDVEILPMTFERPSQLRTAFQFGRILRERQVGILHSHQFRAGLVASPVGRLSGVPVIVETPHIREYWRQGIFTSRFVIDRLVGRCVNYYIANCNANARYLIEQKGLPARKIIVIYSGGDLKRFNHDRLPPMGLKASLGFAESDPVLVVVGRLDPQKGHAVLLEALSQVRHQFPTVRLVCVGEGALRAALERQTRELGLAASVRFVGYRSDVPEWVALADAMVLPSFFEGMPLAPIESLAAGRPVVATAVDGTSEIVVDGETGLTVPAGDSARLASAICRILADPELRRRLGSNGHRFVHENFGDERLVERSQEFYLTAWQTRGASRTATGAASQADRCTYGADSERFHGSARPLR